MKSVKRVAIGLAVLVATTEQKGTQARGQCRATIWGRCKLKLNDELSPKVPLARSQVDLRGSDAQQSDIVYIWEYKSIVAMFSI